MLRLNPTLAVSLILAHGFAALGKNKPSIVTVCSWDYEVWHI